jgi:hypothetical protein
VGYRFRSWRCRRATGYEPGGDIEIETVFGLTQEAFAADLWKDDAAFATVWRIPPTEIRLIHSLPQMKRSTHIGMRVKPLSIYSSERATAGRVAGGPR